MPYWTPSPTAPPAGTALLMANDVCRTTNPGPYLSPGRAACNGHT